MRRTADRRTGVVLALLGLVLATGLVAASTLLRPPPGPAAGAPPARDVLASLPVSFEPAADGAFVSRGPGYSLSLTSSGAVVGVGDGAFRLRPAGGSAAPLVGTRPTGTTVTRFVGDGVLHGTAYARVEAQQVWPGVDMVWHGDQHRLEHDMVVAPGVDPSVVAFDVDGATSLAIDPGGDLLVDLGRGAARLARPVVYQDVAGSRRHVAGEFTLLGPSRIGFRVGAYDTGLPLVIDPTLVTSTFLGGIGNDSGYAIAVDGEGNTYVTGTTESADFPVNAPAQAALINSAAGPTSDVFVSKLSPDGTRLVWSTYVGGRGRDTGYGIAVGADGSVYVAGVTESPDFPRANAAQEAFGAGASDAFVAKIAAGGTSLAWSTLVGGTQTDRARGVAVDTAGNAYVTGSTNSVDFPKVGAYPAGPFGPDDTDAFLVKVPSAGGPFTYATRLGGGSDDRGLAVAVDAQGSPYVTGDTLSPRFPTVRPLQAGLGGAAGAVAGSSTDAFVSKFNPNGSELVYSTYLGGGDVDQGTAIAVDGQGAAYVAGNTNSPNFPTAAALHPAKGNDADAFVTKIDPTGGALVYSTFVGGSAADGANAIAVDGAGNAHVTGTTGSGNWATVRPTQPTRAGGEDAFVLKLDPAGRGPLFSTFLGGRDADAGMGIALDAQGDVHVLGLSASADFPSVKPVQGSRPAAGGDAFVATIDMADAAPAAAPPGAAAAPAGRSTSSSTSAHDRRVRILGALTLTLLLAAVAQTIFLKRRTPVPAAPPPRPVKPQPQTRARPGTAAPGLKVLGEAAKASGVGAATNTGAAKAGAGAGSGSGAKSNRSPKARGGPKGPAGQKGGPQKAGGRPKGATTKAGAGAGAGAGATATAKAADVTRTDVADDGGPPTVATPPARVRPQNPAIAQLLEEDLWGPPEPGGDVTFHRAEPVVGDERPAADDKPAAEGPAAPAPPEASTAPSAPDHPPAAAPPPPPPPPSRREPPPGPEPAPAIPPVPAEELSFWDLFPEDLPPARPEAFPVEDLLVDRLALPEGPDSVAGRILPPAEPRAQSQAQSQAQWEPEGAPEPEPARPPHPPEAEIVIAELLDGPVPTGLRPAADAPWAPQAQADDIVISDLLASVGPAGSPDGEAGTPADQNGDDGGDGEDDVAPATAGRSREEQARLAADRARRRRARRGGRRRPGSG